MTRHAAVIDRCAKSRYDAAQYVWVHVGNHGDLSSADLGEAAFDGGRLLRGQRLRGRDLCLDDTQVVEQPGTIRAHDVGEESEAVTLGHQREEFRDGRSDVTESTE